MSIERSITWPLGDSCLLALYVPQRCEGGSWLGRPGFPPGEVSRWGGGWWGRGRWGGSLFKLTYISTINVFSILCLTLTYIAMVTSGKDSSKLSTRCQNDVHAGLMVLRVDTNAGNNRGHHNCFSKHVAV